MNVTIRMETADDHREVENLVREAFWNLYKPGCDEHLVLHKLRTRPSYVGELDLVATIEQRIVASIVYSKAYVANEKNEQFEVLCMGPVSVLPEHQNKGIGSLLINETAGKAKKMGYKAIVLFGNPKYYARFGFVNAKEYHIKTSEGQNFDAFMVLDLSDNRLAGIEGRFFVDPVFQVDIDELNEFEKAFPPKEKLVTETQLKMDSAG